MWKGYRATVVARQFERDRRIAEPAIPRALD
jgi:hypothetical protein